MPSLKISSFSLHKQNLCKPKKKKKKTMQNMYLCNEKNGKLFFLFIKNITYEHFSKNPMGKFGVNI